MLGADVGVTQLEGLAKRELQDLLGARGEGWRARRRVGGRADGLFDLLAHDVEGDPQGVQRLGGDTFALADEAQQNVLGAYERVVEVTCFFLSEYKYSTGPVCESFEQLSSFRY